MPQVKVAVTRCNSIQIARIVEGGEAVRALPGAKQHALMTMVDRSTPIDDPSMILGTLRALGGDEWHADTSWTVVDGSGKLVYHCPAFSERGDSART
jgi:hypothetical protein